MADHDRSIDGEPTEGVELALPDGRRLVVRTENQALQGALGEIVAEEAQEAAAAARREGRDLGGWTGGSIWESGEILARLLLACGELVRGKRVIELGAGCGLLGLTAGALGAAESLLTDNVTFMARANLEENFRGADRSRIRVARLRWGDAADIASVRPPFDLIMGSDIIYHRDSQIQLADTIEALSAPGTVVLWATPDGSGSDEPAPEAGGRKSLGVGFFERMRSLGFELSDVTEEPAVQEAIRVVEGSRPPKSLYETDPIYGGFYSRGQIRVTRMVKPAAKL